jgi:hypothetical protein
VNIICPGPIETQLLEDNRKWGAIYPQGMPPEEISPMYLFLASDTIKRPYRGREIDQYSFSELLTNLRKEIGGIDFDIKELLKSMKEKLNKDTYTMFRKNQALAEFMLKYKRES